MTHIDGMPAREWRRAYYHRNSEAIQRRTNERRHKIADRRREAIEREHTGKRFGGLVTLYPLVRTNKHGGGWWLCQCDCGREIEAWMYRLKRGSKTSCGCGIHQRRKRVERKMGLR